MNRKIGTTLSVLALTIGSVLMAAPAEAKDTTWGGRVGDTTWGG